MTSKEYMYLLERIRDVKAEMMIYAEDFEDEFGLERGLVCAESCIHRLFDVSKETNYIGEKEMNAVCYLMDSYIQAEQERHPGKIADRFTEIMNTSKKLIQRIEKQNNRYRSRRTEEQNLRE